MRRKNFPGNRRGTFTLLEPVLRTAAGPTIWRARCDCGAVYERWLHNFGEKCIRCSERNRPSGERRTLPQKSAGTRWHFMKLWRRFESLYFWTDELPPNPPRTLERVPSVHPTYWETRL